MLYFKNKVQHNDIIECDEYNNNFKTIIIESSLLIMSYLNQKIKKIFKFAFFLTF